MKLLVSLFFATLIVAIVLGCILATPLPSRADGYGGQRILRVGSDCGCAQQVQYAAPVVQYVAPVVQSYAVQQVQQVCEPVYRIQQVQSYAAPVVLRQNVYANRFAFRQNVYSQRAFVRQRFVGDYGGNGLLNINLGGPRRSSVRVGGGLLNVRVR